MTRSRLSVRSSPLASLGGLWPLPPNEEKMRDEGISTIIIHFSHLLHALAPQRGKGSAPLRLVEKIKDFNN